jgi:outer membrane protein TolC
MTQGAADREVYGRLAAERRRVPEVEGSLDLEAAERAAAPCRCRGEVVLDLPTSLRIAMAASREYRTRREDAYLKALAWTQQRRNFETQPGAGLAAALSDGPDGGSASVTPRATLSKAFEAGGSFVLKLATDFLTAFAGDPLTAAQTVLTADLILPLARGSGTLVAREALTQAEREVLYALRDFARFQQEFSVDVAVAFYRTVESRDTLANEVQTLESLLRLQERTKSFGPEGAGRIPDFQVDQARQDVLRAEERRVRAEQALQASIDQLVLRLGLRVGTKATIAENALDTLRARGLEPPGLDLGPAVATALSRRVDLATLRDRLEDAHRHVAVAARAMGAEASLVLGGDLSTPARTPFDVRRISPTGRAGFDLDLPFERTAERNALRTARIDVDRARRAVEGGEDEITAAVRQDLRSLESAKRSYDIQVEGVRLATRRVESADLNLQAGNATTRDVLEAENARIEAKNALTRALIDYATTRLSFLRDVGLLRSEDVTGGPLAAGVAPCDLGVPVPIPATAAPSSPAGDSPAASPPSSSAPTSPGEPVPATSEPKVR